MGTCKHVSSLLPEHRALAIALLLFVSLSPTFQAAAQPGPEEREARLDTIVARLDERLALTDAQAEQIRPILLEHMDEMWALWAQAQEQERSARRELMLKMRKRQEGTDEQIEAVLTEEQRTEYRKLREEQRQWWREWMSQRRSGGI